MVKGLTHTAYNTELVRVGKCDHRDELIITDEAQKITITPGKHTIEIIIIGDNHAYYGGQGVTSADGFPFYRRSRKVWNNVKSNWSIWIICAAEKNSKGRINEYD